MPICKVWNDNVHIYEEKFKGVNYIIAPKGCVEMELDEAHQFLGTFKAIVKRGDDTVDPRCYKMLRIEAPPVPPAPIDPLLCHATGQVAESEAALKAILKQFAHNKAFDEEAEKAASKMKDENALLRQELAEIKEMVLGLSAIKKRKKDEPHVDEPAGV